RRHVLPGAAGGLAACVGFHFVLTPIIEERLCPWLEGRVGVGQTATARSPNPFLARFSAKSRLSIRPSRCGCCRSSVSAATSAAATSATTLSALSTLTASPTRSLTLASRSRPGCSGLSGVCALAKHKGGESKRHEQRDRNGAKQPHRTTLHVETSRLRNLNQNGHTSGEPDGGPTIIDRLCV